MLALYSLVALAATFNRVLALPAYGYEASDDPGSCGSCPPFEGDFTINQFQMYHENADFDFKSCLLYIGNLFNSSVTIYDPYKKEVVDILEFPGITRNPKQHVGGLQMNTLTNLLSVIVETQPAFLTSPPDVSGTNMLLLWDPEKKEVLYNVNLTQTSQGKYGAFQDVEHDPEGRTYVVGTFPGSILRVEEFDGKTPPTVKPWYLSEPINTNRSGLTGLAAKDWSLLSSDNNGGRLLKFDMRSETGTPVRVPLSQNYTFAPADAVFLPPRYDGNVLLVAESMPGMTVLRSCDGEWNSAEYLGTVPRPANLPNTTFTTAPAQIGNSVYMIATQFFEPNVPGTLAGNRTAFPYYDITAQVEKMLEKPCGRLAAEATSEPESC